MKMRLILIVVVVASIVYGCLWIDVANPFNFFVPRSARFTLNRFRSIRPSGSVVDAAKLLGEPTKVVKENRFDPECPACIEYCFMGEPPNWIVGFHEAWLVADQQGRVVRVFENTEP
jgi:hypothetical protein